MRKAVAKAAHPRSSAEFGPAGQSLGVLLVIAATALGCAPTVKGPGASVTAAARPGSLRPVAVTEETFGPALQQYLTQDEETAEHRNLGAGLVRRQLQRSASRLGPNQSDAGVAALFGALLLMQAGDFDPAVLQGGEQALREGSEAVARTGNEGYALALYSMLASTLGQGSEREDVELHLKALAEWRKASANAGPMQALGAEQRLLAHRSILEPTAEALEEATRATVEWIRRAMTVNLGETPIRTTFERDEALEAYRAMRTGTFELIALYTRHGNPMGAVRVLDGADLSRMVHAPLRERIEAIADNDDPSAWRDLHQFFVSAEKADERMLSPELARAGIWGSAVGYYRSQPNDVAAAMSMAQLLVEYGMAESAPLVLATGVSEQPGAREVSVALAIVLRAILLEDEVGQIEGARRTYAAAAPLRELAEDKALAGQIAPTPARLAYVMGALEARAGQLDRARPYIEKAAQAEPSFESLTLLAAIERQRGEAARALAAIERAAALAEKAGNTANEVEALLTRFEIHRDAGDAAKAEQTLKLALTHALTAQKAAAANAEQARAERLLARVLEYYGDAQAARRATDRAFEAARSDTRQFTATVLDAARRAFTRGDLTSARSVVQRAIDADLEDEDLIYVTLWLQLLERQLKVQGDGTAEAAYAAIDGASGWVGKLKAWGRGKLTSEELLKSATNRVEATEAKFYTAMANHTRGERDALLPPLREVASSEAIELVEVTIARDLLSELTQTAVKPRLPPEVRIP